jgi:hypothetical protein
VDSFLICEELRLALGGEISAQYQPHSGGLALIRMQQKTRLESGARISQAVNVEASCACLATTGIGSYIRPRISISLFLHRQQFYSGADW